MRFTPTPGSVAGRRTDKAGDPLDGLINLFDLSLVLAVGLLLAALSSIGATGLIVPQGTKGTPLNGQPPTNGQNGQGQGQEVGKVYRLQDGSFVFAPSEGSSQSGGGSTGGAGATSSTGTTGGATGGATGSTSSTPVPTGATSIPPASTTPTPATGITTD
ncbi:MAG: DUF2149 domain-containing protein [Actinobacteria bacterium]|nr:DUF2149 domain-containing protein [Actinomycetota bacterium]